MTNDESGFYSLSLVSVRMSGLLALTTTVCKRKRYIFKILHLLDAWRSCFIFIFFCITTFVLCDRSISLMYPDSAAHARQPLQRIKKKNNHSISFSMVQHQQHWPCWRTEKINDAFCTAHFFSPFSLSLSILLWLFCLLYCVRWFMRFKFLMVPTINGARFQTLLMHEPDDHEEKKVRWKIERECRRKKCIIQMCGMNRTEKKQKKSALR